MTPGEILLPGGRVETGWWGPGPEAAPTILLLHEGLGSLRLWRDLPARLAAMTGCGVFAWSRLGYGFSDPVPLPRPLDYLRREATEALPRVLDATGLRRGLLFGHSDGASIAAIHAGAVPDPRIAGLVLVAPHFFIEAVALDGIVATRRRYEAGELRERLARHHRHVDIAFRGWCETWLHPAFPGSFDLRPELGRIRVPVLALQGEADGYGTEDQLRVLEDLAPGPVERRMLPGLGHAPQMEAPEMVLPLVRDFAKRVLSAAPPASPAP